jgi:hypothetical protein
MLLDIYHDDLCIDFRDIEKGWWLRKTILVKKVEKHLVNRSTYG